MSARPKNKRTSKKRAARLGQSKSRATTGPRRARKPDLASWQAQSAGPDADRALVELCVTGQPAAWSALYRQCHEPLLAAIRQILRSSGPDDSLVEEVAARVWYAVVKDEAALLSRFDAAKGCRLLTFLSTIARFEARQYLRSERRLRDREHTASRHLPREQPPEVISTTDFREDFLARLTPREREFFDLELIGAGEKSQGESFSVSNSWQLRHRVSEKLEAFFRE